MSMRLFFAFLKTHPGEAVVSVVILAYIAVRASVGAGCATCILPTTSAQNKTNSAAALQDLPKEWAAEMSIEENEEEKPLSQ